jgi:hypothetical protein
MKKIFALLLVLCFLSGSIANAKWRVETQGGGDGGVHSSTFDIESTATLSIEHTSFHIEEHIDFVIDYIGNNACAFAFSWLNTTLTGTEATGCDGTGNDGTYTGFVAADRGIQGRMPYITFNDSADEFTISANANLDINGYGNWVIGFSIRPDAVSGTQRLFTKVGTYYIQLVDDSVEAVLQDAGSDPCQIITDTGVIAADTWYHIIIVMDEDAGTSCADNSEIYINGVAANKATEVDAAFNGGPSDTANDFTINLAASPYSGDIGKVWPKRAGHSADQIFQTYNHMRAIACDTGC